MKLLLTMVSICLWTVAAATSRETDSLLTTRARSLQPGTAIAIAQPTGLLLAGSTKAGAWVAMTDSVGTPRWQQNYPGMLAIDVARKQLAVVSVGPGDKLLLTVSDLTNRGNTRWTAELASGTQPDVVVQADGSVVVVAYTEKGITLFQQKATGKGWEQFLQRPAATTETHAPLQLLALPDGGLVLTIGGTALGLDKAGTMRWQFDTKPDDVQWNRLRLLRNGQVVLVGEGTASAFNPNNVDGRVMAIDPKSGKQLWLKILGDYGTKESAVDTMEEPDGTLLVLVQEPAQGRLVRINARHESRSLAILRPVGQGRYRALLSLGNGHYGALLNQAPSGQALLQTWGGTTTPLPTRRPGPAVRPTLYGLAVGIPFPPSQFAAADAAAVAKALEQEKGKAFGQVQLELLNTPDRASTTQLAATLERWSLTLKPQPDDWVLVYVSGLAIDLRHDLRLVGADYDPAAPRSTSLSLRTLLRDLNALPCRKLVLLDVGQPWAKPGTYSPNPAENPTFSFEAKDFPDTYVLLASQPDQRVFEDSVWQHGAFTRALLDGLAGPADTNQDGQLLLSELNAYLSETVPALVRTQKQKIQQPTWLIRQKEDAVLLEK